MFPYRLSPTYESDLVVVLDASHAYAFMQASSAALRVMEALGQSQSTLGILKTRDHFILGRMEFSNTTVVETSSIDDFGAKLMLSEQRANVLLLRNQINGHLRTAMNNTMSAFEAKALHLIFHKGGPLFIISPSVPGNPYRIALIRLQGADTIKDERICVAVNRASKMTYREIWGALSKMAIEHAEREGAEAVDVLDQANAEAEDLDDAEDQIDAYTENDLDYHDGDEENAEPAGLSEDYLPTAPSHQSDGDQSVNDDPDNFDINETSRLEF